MFLTISTLNLLYNKRVRPTKNEPQQGISYLERAREGCERERGGWMGFKVRLGLGEIEGRDRDRETYKQRDIETELTIKIPSKAG